MLPEPQTARAALDVRVARANFYLSREICDAHLAGLHSVALLQHEDRVLIVPLMPGSAGGLLLKLRNGRGDRVIHAQEFFRTHGYLEDFEERHCELRWDAKMAALEVCGLARVPSNG